MANFATICTTLCLLVSTNPLYSLRSLAKPLLPFKKNLKNLKMLPRGPRGVPEIYFSLESSFFCNLGAHAKFHNPSCLLSCRKVRALEKKREKMPSTMATTLRWGMHSARTLSWSWLHGNDALGSYLN